MEGAATGPGCAGGGMAALLAGDGGGTGAATGAREDARADDRDALAGDDEDLEEATAGARAGTGEDDCAAEDADAASELDALTTLAGFAGGRGELALLETREPDDAHAGPKAHLHFGEQYRPHNWAPVPAGGSHSSPICGESTPSPHVKNLQLVLQDVCPLRQPSSHCSPGCTTPLPHWADEVWKYWMPDAAEPEPVT